MKSKIEVLKKELDAQKRLTQMELEFGNMFAEQTTKSNKALSVLIPLINQEHLRDILAEYYDFKHPENNLSKVLDLSKELNTNR